MKKFFKWFSEIEIINWNKINTYSFWGGLFFTICHPIYSFKYDRHCYGSFFWKLNRFFTRIVPAYMPFSKPARWLGYKLICRVYNCKELDNFECRTRGENTKYYFATCKLCHLKLEEVQYMRNGKGVNTFMDCFVTTLVDEKQGKENVNQIKTVKKTIWSGFVFSKKQAFRLFKKIVLENKDIYNPTGKEYPEIEENYYMLEVDCIENILKTGKLKDWMYNDLEEYIKDIFDLADDKIEKLWCYVTHLLCLPNDFNQHVLLANIHSTCENYIYHKKMKINPEMCDVYVKLKEQGKTKEAKKVVKDLTDLFTKDKTINSLQKLINQLRLAYMKQPYKYFRVI